MSEIATMTSTMIHEWRTYRLKPGAAGQYLTLFGQVGLPLVTRHLPLMGYWLAETGPLNVIHHLWSYRDWSEREARRATLAQEPDWTKGFIPKAFGLVEEQDNRLLKLTQTSEIFEAVLAKRDTVRPAMETQAPLYADHCACMVTDVVVDGAVAAWETISGDGARTLALLPRKAEPLPTSTLKAGTHTVLRPLCYSPL